MLLILKKRSNSLKPKVVNAVRWVGGEASWKEYFKGYLSESKTFQTLKLLRSLPHSTEIHVIIKRCQLLLTPLDNFVRLRIETNY